MMCILFLFPNLACSPIFLLFPILSYPILSFPFDYLFLCFSFSISCWFTVRFTVFHLFDHILNTIYRRPTSFPHLPIPTSSTHTHTHAHTHTHIHTHTHTHMRIVWIHQMSRYRSQRRATTHSKCRPSNQVSAADTSTIVNKGCQSFLITHSEALIHSSFIRSSRPFILKSINSKRFSSLAH